jgi:hypothetical protein
MPQEQTHAVGLSRLDVGQFPDDSRFNVLVAGKGAVLPGDICRLEDQANDG